MRAGYRMQGASYKSSTPAMMNKLLVTAIIIFCLAGAASQSRAQAARSEDISKEFEYIESVIHKGVSDGDMNMLARAHRAMSNLEMAVTSLNKPEDRILFTLAAAYNYVDLCPTAGVLSLSATTNPTGFSFDCIERAEYYFNKARSLAESSSGLSKGTVADVSFLIGIGYDRLKANLAGLNVDTKRFYDLAMNYIRKSVELGAGFDGVTAILKRILSDDYKNKPVIGDEQYNDLRRMLYFERALPQPANTAATDTSTATSTISIAKPSDDNSYIDYQWRFSVRKPDRSWQFAIRKSSNSFYLTIKKKDPAQLEGSGLNIVCRSLNETEAQMPPDKLIEKSLDLLKQAGYEIKSQKSISHNGVPAQEIISMHQYKDLIQKSAPVAGDQKQPDAAQKLVSKQYMVIAVSNNIEYIVSFNSLEAEYARIFPEYKLIANSITMF
ncbi:MAG: hypothetical protein WCX65_00875 [bacterium]